MTDAGPTVELVNRYQNGDDQIRNELCERLLPHVYRAVRAQLGPKIRKKMESGDIVGEAMMECLRAINTADTQSDGAFIYKCVNQIVKNRVIDQDRFYKAKKREKVDPAGAKNIVGGFASADEGPAPIDKADSRQLTPSQIALNRESDEQVNKAMDQLKENSPDQWELIWKHRFCQLTLKELALEMDKKYDAVRMQYSRAEAALAKQYLGLFGDDDQGRVN